MLYAILCYNSEDIVGAWTKEENAAVMARLGVVQEKLARQGRLGPVARLLPTTAATTVRKGEEPLVLRRDQGAASRLLRRGVRHARGRHRDGEGADARQWRRGRL